MRIYLRNFTQINKISPGIKTYDNCWNMITRGANVYEYENGNIVATGSSNFRSPIINDNLSITKTMRAENIILIK